MTARSCKVVARERIRSNYVDVLEKIAMVAETFSEIHRNKKIKIFHQLGQVTSVFWAKDNRYFCSFSPAMGAIKVIVDDEVEKRFRKIAMKRYGYGKGALSEAAEAAFGEWSSHEDTDVKIPREILRDPVSTIEGLLRDVMADSVELQHEASRIRAKRSTTHAKTVH